MTNKEKGWNVGARDIMERIRQDKAREAYDRACEAEALEDLDARVCPVCGKYGADGHTLDCEVGEQADTRALEDPDLPKMRTLSDSEFLSAVEDIFPGGNRS